MPKRGPKFTLALLFPLLIATVLTTTPEKPASAAPPARRIDVPSDMTAGYAVFDHTTGTETAGSNEHARFRSTSIVKLLIALDYLESRGPGYAPSGNDLALLQSMLRSSNDDAASTLWVRDGWQNIVQRMIPLIGLTDTAPPDNRGMWGYTEISAADVVKTYRYILDVANPKYRDFIMSNLHQETPCGADGFDQSFGIPTAAPPPWAIKQGWSGFGDHPAPGKACTRGNRLMKPPESREEKQDAMLAPGEGRAGRVRSGASRIDLTRPAMHTTGTLGPADDQIIVVLTLEPVGTPWETSADRITTLTKELYQGATSD